MKIYTLSNPTTSPTVFSAMSAQPVSTETAREEPIHPLSYFAALLFDYRCGQEEMDPISFTFVPFSPQGLLKIADCTGHTFCTVDINHESNRPILEALTEYVWTLRGIEWLNRDLSSFREHSLTTKRGNGLQHLINYPQEAWPHLQSQASLAFKLNEMENQRQQLAGSLQAFIADQNQLVQQEIEDLSRDINFQEHFSGFSRRMFERSALSHLPSMGSFQYAGVAEVHQRLAVKEEITLFVGEVIAVNGQIEISQEPSINKMYEACDLYRQINSQTLTRFLEIERDGSTICIHHPSDGVYKLTANDRQSTRMHHLDVYLFLYFLRARMEEHVDIAGGLAAKFLSQMTHIWESLDPMQSMALIDLYLVEQQKVLLRSLQAFIGQNA
ncbi:Conserved hypothetical protein [Candidatus Protochlamydia naegleriophila]|uniref:Uncharacterized protein n=1 Tax=Candidatus Protochlamydia naegleriophila TaxID=389348 RepID=A0A0U5JCJ4_9BACT|nr:hypothetical protein [Candidatus Protochlamydia naegleriophila]CUI17592.1 Conserved hypothetical protein [Candidatus Protochlamydia naegleriophila]